MEQQHTQAPLRLAGGRFVEARRAGLARQTSAPHRLEPVASIGDVLYVNDSRATFLDAALLSLAEFDRRVVWITGAWSEDLLASDVRMLIEERVHAVVLFGPQPDDATERVPVRAFHTEELRTAVFVARELAEAGDVVLFSPGCPSGNGFANYEERGAEFRRAVRDL